MDVKPDQGSCLLQVLVSHHCGKPTQNKKKLNKNKNKNHPSCPALMLDSNWCVDGSEPQLAAALVIIVLLHVVRIGCHKGYKIMSTAASQMVDTLHVYMHCPCMCAVIDRGMASNESVEPTVCGSHTHQHDWVLWSMCWKSWNTATQRTIQLLPSNKEMKGRWRGDGVWEINAIHLFRCQTALILHTQATQVI